MAIGGSPPIELHSEDAMVDRCTSCYGSTQLLGGHDISTASKLKLPTSFSSALSSFARRWSRRPCNAKPTRSAIHPQTLNEVLARLERSGLTRTVAELRLHHKP